MINNRYVVMSSLVIIGLVCAMFMSYGQPPPGSIVILQSVPEVFLVKTTTTIRIRVRTTGEVIPGSVNLVRVNASGLTVVLGQFVPDSSDSGSLSLSINLNEATPTTLVLQVSAAIRGQLRRITSPLFLLAASTKQIVLPPDPGTPGKATLGGLDSDHDGVRDDVQRSIVLNHPESESIRAALLNSALAMQSSAINSSTPSTVLVNAGYCLYYVASQKGVDVNVLLEQLEKVQLNTTARFQASLAPHAGPYVVSTPSNTADACPFKLSTMEN